MTTRERRIFRASLTGLLLIWVTVIVVFSPWGLAKPDVTEQPTVESSSLNF